MSVDGWQGVSFQQRKLSMAAQPWADRQISFRQWMEQKWRWEKKKHTHCITNLLSKFYYLGHGLLYGCQSYHTKHWSNSPYLVSPAPKHKHIEKAKCCKCNHHADKQWAVVNYRLTYHCILFYTGSWALSNYCQHHLVYKDYSPQSWCL